MKTSMEHWWNDTDRGKQKYWEKNICQSATFLPQAHINSVSNPGLRGYKSVTKRLSHGTFRKHKFHIDIIKKTAGVPLFYHIAHIDSGSNHGLRGDKSVTKRLSHGTFRKHQFHTEIIKKLSECHFSTTSSHKLSIEPWPPR